MAKMHSVMLDGVLLDATMTSSGVDALNTCSL